MSFSRLHENLCQKYTYAKQSPQFSSPDGSFLIYNGIDKQINIKVTIKLLLKHQPQLKTYLTKIKSIKSQMIAKIYAIIVEGIQMALIQEQVSFGTLDKVLANCKRFDDFDAVFIVKYLLNGQIDLLRAGVDWFGTINDMEVTQTGLKISWNNSMSYCQESRSFKKMLQQICYNNSGQTQQKLLIFPQNKLLKQLIVLSESSASQISLHPSLKKKQKYIKKKLLSYIILRETKQSSQYFEQTIQLGIHKQYGLVKIKVYQKGKIMENVIQLNKTKDMFTKVLQVIEENNRTSIVSLYSNDGNMQAYVNRLKQSAIQLKQDQIQFLFYSLFEPLKIIQQSPIKSLNMSIHIKNIYFQNGILKIGQPIPLNSEIELKLTDRSQVPDFYHRKFKQVPQSSSPSYDTYSLGVLLYKLMYTQYPIFPKQQVHIPTTPTYNPRLKKTLQIFLNQGGKLSQIQKRIQVSQNVLKQVKKNKEKLVNQKQQKIDKNNKQQKYLQLQDQQQHQQYNDQIVEKQVEDEDQQLLGDDCLDCCLALEIADHTVDKQVQSLEQSPYKIYRSFTKLFILLLITILVFYLTYLTNNFQMLSSSASLSVQNITISTVKYQITTSSSTNFYLAFNQTTKSLNNLIGMGCFINDLNGNTDFYQFAYPKSPKYLAYLIGGLLLMVFIVVMKSLLVFRFDWIKVKFNYQHGRANYNYSNYIIGNLLLAALMNHHFYFFNMIFSSTQPTCLGSSVSYSHTDYMFNHNSTFISLHLPILLFFIVLTLLQFLMTYHTQSINYTKLFNPILFFTPFLIAYYVVVRIGVIGQGYFQPTALADKSNVIKGYFLSGDYVAIIGIIPELIFIVEFLINKLVDLLYWLIIDKKRLVMIINQTSTQNIQILQ